MQKTHTHTYIQINNLGNVCPTVFGQPGTHTHTLIDTDTDTIPPCAAPRTAAVHKMVDACGTFVAASPNFKQ